MNASAACYEAARAALASGISVVPPAEDGTKQPITAWKVFQSRRPGPERLHAWYVDDRRTGVGFVCGAVSGNLEMLEFEHADVYDEFKAAAQAVGLAPVIERIEGGYLEATPGGGFHLLYRCDEIAGNSKLARRPTKSEEMQHPKDTVRVKIETRGERGFTVAAPSNGRVHPTGKPYVLLRGGVATIATITPEERRDLWDLARTFDEMPRERAKEPRDAKPSAGGTRPGDDFNARADWAGILEPHGWTYLYTRGETGYWRRPGKDRGISATTNHAGSELFWPFTSSSEFEPERSYTKFGAYALLNHGGDFRAAKEALRFQGYGAQPPNGTDQVSDRPPPAEARKLTEAANAEDFCRRNGKYTRYDHRLGRWLRFRQHRWHEDADGEVNRLALQAARDNYHEAGAIADLEVRTKVAAWAIKSESRSRLSATLDIARSLHPIADDGKNWDANPYLLGCTTGVIDLSNGRLRDGRTDDRVTMTTGVAFDPNAVAPRWEKFLTEIFSNDRELIDYIQRVVGYCLTGDMSAQAFWLLYGQGGNGKSVFLRALALILGDYFADVPFATFARGRGEHDTYALARMEARRLVIASESGDTARLNTERIKAITGGDPITARRPYQDYLTFTPMCKLMLTANHPPVVSDGTYAFWRRVRLIPFQRRFEGKDIDEHLDDTLATEAPGILAWAVRGALAWATHGLDAPEAVMAATRDYETESDPLAEWIGERCTLDESARHWGSELYADYVAWCDQHRVSERERLANSTFGRKLGERFKKSMSKGRTSWWGLRLNPVPQGGLIIGGKPTTST